ncbi:MAG: hypothetical protein Q9168_008055 [Polycauliona sp. 1 TL-2023]
MLWFHKSLGPQKRSANQIYGHIPQFRFAEFDWEETSDGLVPRTERLVQGTSRLIPRTESPPNVNAWVSRAYQATSQCIKALNLMVSPPPKFSRFLDLPLEIRDIIYEYCLVMPGEIVPYPSLLEKRRERMNAPCEKPTVALLQTSHQVRNESRPFLYGQNVWRLSFQQGGPLPTTVWEANAPFFRHITTNFHPHDMTTELQWKLYKRSLEIYAIEGPRAISALPKLRLVEFERLCQRKLAAIQEIMAHGNLVTLRLDFEKLGEPFIEDREKRWDIMQKLAAFRDLTRGMAALEEKNFLHSMRRQRVWRDLLQDQARVKRRPEQCSLYMILVGLEEDECEELLRNASEGL